MGLSADRKKQKIGNDPRNLNWSENAARFGHAYLSKLGWSAAAGLGPELEGRTKHIAVAQKLNMLGIGADTKDGPEAIAWKQNQEFEAVLLRLNKGKAREAPSSATIPTADVVTTAEMDMDPSGSHASEKQLKRQRKEEKRRRKEERALRRASKALSKSEKEETAAEDVGIVSMASPSSRLIAPLRMAHRARHRAAKNMINQSASALAEVLGESSTPATITPPTAPSTPLTSVYDDAKQTSLVTSSSTSISDYFKQKMQAKYGPPLSIARKPNSEGESRPGIGSAAQKDGLGVNASRGISDQSMDSPNPGTEDDSPSDTPEPKLKKRSGKRRAENDPKEEVGQGGLGAEAVFEDGESSGRRRKKGKA